MKYAFAGHAHNLLTSNSSMGIIFLLAIIFIYLVLAAQFESFIDPLIILLTVPLSMIGALLSFLMTTATMIFGALLLLFSSGGSAYKPTSNWDGDYRRTFLRHLLFN